jgi:hypothetical protein
MERKGNGKVKDKTEEENFITIILFSWHHSYEREEKWFNSRTMTSSIMYR